MKAKELAKKLGVSPATISLVLNNKPGISDSLRHSLLEKIQELGCESMCCEGCLPSSGRQDEPAQPANHSRQAIAYLIYTSSDEADDRFAFYPAVLEGAEMEARENGYNLMVLHMSCQGNANLRRLLQNGGEAMGAIVQISNVDEHALNDIRSLDIPCVLVDSYRPDVRVSSVSINNEQGVFSAVRYLKEKGHQEIGYVYSGWDHDSQRERRRCFHQALLEYGLPDNRSYYFQAGASEDIYDPDRLENLLKSAPKLPTAFLAENDRQAWRTIKALERCGYRVPQDISVIGFDNRSICTMVEPNITSIKNYRHLMGRECVLMLQNLHRLKKQGFKNPCLKLELPTELVERDSVRDLTKK